MRGMVCNGIAVLQALKWRYSAGAHLAPWSRVATGEAAGRAWLSAGTSMLR